MITRRRRALEAWWVLTGRLSAVRQITCVYAHWRCHRCQGTMHVGPMGRPLVHMCPDNRQGWYGPLPGEPEIGRSHKIFSGAGAYLMRAWFRLAGLRPPAAPEPVPALAPDEAAQAPVCAHCSHNRMQHSIGRPAFCLMPGCICSSWERVQASVRG